MIIISLQKRTLRRLENILLWHIKTNKMVKIFFLSISFILVFSGKSDGQLHGFIYNFNSTEFQVQYSSDAIYLRSNGNRLVKTDFYGNVLWAKSVTNLHSLSYYENSLYLTTNNQSLIRMDTSGNVLWCKSFANSICTQYSELKKPICNHNKIYSMADSWFDVANTFFLNDTNGNSINSFCDGGSQLDQYLYDLFPSLDPGVWAVFILSPANQNNEIIVKIDSSGNIDSTIFFVDIGYGYDERVQDILPLTDSNYIAISNTDNGSFFYGDFTLTKFRSDGQVLWKKYYANADTSNQIIRAGTDSLNNIYLVSGIHDLNFFLNTYAIFKIDSGGNFMSGNIIFDPTQSLYFSTTDLHYMRLLINNGSILCPLFFWPGQNGKPCILVFDSLLHTSCGLTDSSFTFTGQDIPTFSGHWSQFPNFILQPPDTIFNSNTVTNIVTNDICDVLFVSSDTREKSGLTLSPIPAIKSFSISDSKNAIQEIEIFNLMGEKIYSAEANREHMTVNCEQWPEGIYFVVAVDENGNKITEMISVIR